MVNVADLFSCCSMLESVDSVKKIINKYSIVRNNVLRYSGY